MSNRKVLGNEQSSRKLDVKGTAYDGKGNPLYSPEDNEYMSTIAFIEDNVITLQGGRRFVWPNIPAYLKAGDLVNVHISPTNRITVVT